MKIRVLGRIVSKSNSDKDAISDLVHRLDRGCVAFNHLIVKMRHFVTSVTNCNLQYTMNVSGLIFNSTDVNSVKELLEDLTAIQTEASKTLSELNHVEDLLTPISRITKLVLTPMVIGAIQSSTRKARINANDIPTWIPDIKNLEILHGKNLSTCIAYTDDIVNKCWNSLRAINVATNIICPRARIIGVPKMPENESEISVYVDVYKEI